MVEEIENENLEDDEDLDLEEDSEFEEPEEKEKPIKEKPKEVPKEPEMSELDKLELEMKYSPKDLGLAKYFAKQKGISLQEALELEEVQNLIRLGRKITTWELNK